MRSRELVQVASNVGRHCDQRMNIWDFRPCHADLQKGWVTGNAYHATHAGGASAASAPAA